MGREKKAVSEKKKVDLTDRFISESALWEKHLSDFTSRNSTNDRFSHSKSMSV